MKTKPSSLDEGSGEFQSQCRGKFKFENRLLANRAIKARGMSAYRCRFCRCWHVGGKGDW